MARLNWVRLDTNWYTNPKFLQLRMEKKWHAIYAYWAALSWCGSQGQNGYLPAYALEAFGATERDASDLLGVGLWHDTDGGYTINDYLEHQPGIDASEKRRTRAQNAARARWSGAAAAAEDG